MNTTAIATQNGSANGELMESVITKGDLSKLTPQERSEYYMTVCRSIGLNPMTAPLAYIVLNGKTVLYAKRDAADQLRKIHGISIEVVKQSLEGELYTVHVRAKDKSGRTDEDFGVVTLGKLQGDARANAILKAITKAKRRVTLSISGLGFLDETEVEDIPKRQNPHVTRPADIVEAAGEIQYDEQGQPIDNIPLGDDRIETMSKTHARPDFAKAQHEMRQAQTPKELETWGKSNANRVSSFPADWQEILRGMYAEQLAELRTKPPPNILQAG